MKRFGILCVAISVVAATVLQLGFGALAEPRPPGLPYSVERVIDDEPVTISIGWGYPIRNWPLILALIVVFGIGVVSLVLPARRSLDVETDHQA